MATALCCIVRSRIIKNEEHYEDRIQKGTGCCCCCSEGKRKKVDPLIQGKTDQEDFNTCKASVSLKPDWHLIAHDMRGQCSWDSELLILEDSVADRFGMKNTTT